MKKPVINVMGNSPRPRRRKSVDYKDMPDGYEKYKKYIQSTDWEKVKEYIYSNVYQKKCYFCGRKEGEDGAVINLHHNSYSNLYDEINHPEDVIPICASCHRRLHSLRSNWKRLKKN